MESLQRFAGCLKFEMTPVEKRRAKFPTTTQPEAGWLRATSIEKSGDLLECGISLAQKPGKIAPGVCTAITVPA